MTTGDPKQAVILALVAIGAIGFVVMRLIPKGSDSPSIALSPRMAEGPKAEEKKEFATTVLSNAFWHPKIGEKRVLEVSTPGPTKGPKRMIEAEEVPPQSPFALGKGPIPSVEITGIDQQLKQGPKVAVAAVIGTNGHREALITIDSSQRKVSVGTVVDGIKVVAITDTTIRVQFGPKEMLIAVGEEKQF